MNSIKRKSCRALLLTPQSEVLLIKIETQYGWTGWITPGGGAEKGETELQTLRRELSEELGLTHFDGNAKVWTRSHAFRWDEKWVEQEEVFFLVRTEKFEPASASGLTEIETKEFREMRWWSIDDIQDSGEKFAPSRLGECLSKLVANPELPTEPIDVGV